MKGPTNNSPTSDRTYASLSSPTSHCCVRNTPSDWTAARSCRFFKAANVGDGLDAVETKYQGY